MLENKFNLVQQLFVIVHTRLHLLNLHRHKRFLQPRIKIVTRMNNLKICYAHRI